MTQEMALIRGPILLETNFVSYVSNLLKVAGDVKSFFVVEASALSIQESGAPSVLAFGIQASNANGHIGLLAVFDESGRGRWLNNCQQHHMHTSLAHSRISIRQVRMTVRRLSMVVFFPWLIASSQGAEGIRSVRLEYALGPSALIYQSVYSMDATFALEGSVRGPVSGAWEWQAGGRLELFTARTEIFARVLVSESFASWRPSIGLEAGITNRARWTDGNALLREARRSMDDVSSPFYFAWYSAPLSFEVREGWRLSVAELQIGSHFGRVGRTTRVQVGLITLGARL